MGRPCAEPKLKASRFRTLCGIQLTSGNIFNYKHFIEQSKQAHRNPAIAQKVTICYHGEVESRPTPAEPSSSPNVPSPEPCYDRREVQQLASDASARRLTRTALDGCLELGLASDVVWETLGALNSPECRFIKTLDSEQRAGEKLDVYDALVCGHQVYVKIKIVQVNGESKLLVVLSFKRNEYYDRNVR